MQKKYLELVFRDTWVFVKGYQIAFYNCLNLMESLRLKFLLSQAFKRKARKASCYTDASLGKEKIKSR